MVIKATGSDCIISGSAKRSKLTGLDQSDELIPFGMAQPDHIVGLTNFHSVGLDGHFRAVIAFGA
jgi:hypothetical protein